MSQSPLERDAATTDVEMIDVTADLVTLPATADDTARLARGLTATKARLDSHIRNSARKKKQSGKTDKGRNAVKRSGALPQ
jgi:hypothetical protein